MPELPHAYILPDWSNNTSLNDAACERLSTCVKFTGANERLVGLPLLTDDNLDMVALSPTITPVL